MQANPVFNSYPNPRSNVFLMMRFRSTEYHAQIGQAIEPVLPEYSLNLIRADSSDYTPQLWDNVELCMNACEYGIAVFVPSRRPRSAQRGLRRYPSRIGTTT
jgi:hypothetical protein